MENLIAKRVRRCEVSDLVFTDELTDLRSAVRALYEAVLLISRRIPRATLGSDPADILMMPPWYVSPKTGDLLPPPAGLDITQEKQGFSALRLKLSTLTDDQQAAVRAAQNRLPELREMLMKREVEREKQLKQQGGPTM